MGGFGDRRESRAQLRIGVRKAINRQRLPEFFDSLRHGEAVPEEDQRNE